MNLKFIPLDYSSFDFNGRNYAKIYGRNENGKRACIIDSCPVYLWAILKEGISEKQVKILISKIEKIELDAKGRQTKVEKVELHNKNFLGKSAKAMKIFATNYKDLHELADELDFPEIKNRRGYDLGFITHYIIEKKLSPLNWYEVKGEMLNNSEEFGGIDSVIEADIVIKAEEINPIKSKNKFNQSAERGAIDKFNKSDERSEEQISEDRRAISREKFQLLISSGVASLAGTPGFTPKILAYDIETDEFQIGKGEILMISLVSSDGLKKVLTWKKSKNAPDYEYIEYVKDEAELIEKFIEYAKKISPDFLVGYFSDGFDLPYLKARAEHHKIKLSLGLDGSQPKFSRGREMRARTEGIVHIDLFKFIRTAYSQYLQSETLSLDDIAKEFLGDSKKDFEIKHSSKIADHEWEKYYKYNLHDSVLVLNLFEKFWPDVQEFTKIIQEPIFEVSRNGMSSNVEDYIIHNLERFNEIPEKRPTYEEIAERRSREKYEGAFVLEPTPGLYEDMTIFDFTSMHASIIVTYNLSKSTLLEEKEEQKTKGFLTNSPLASQINEKNRYESPEFELNGRKTKFYFSKEKGFFSELLKELVEKRKQYKKELKQKPDIIKKARSNAFKLLANAYYGYLGFFGARYYSVEAAASTLAFVRKFNKETIEKVQKKGYKVIFSDTDSVGFLIDKKPESEILELLKELNSQLPGIMELELEDFYKRGIWVTTRAGIVGAKKKYALINKGGKIKIRGFETVRRDWCPLAREVQDKILRQILSDGNEKKALEYLKEIIKKLKERKIGKNEIIIRTQLKKPISEYKAITPHVIAAQKMHELEIPVTQGNLIEYYIAETREKKKLVREKVKLPEEKGEYNIEYYLHHQILPAVENIFQVFNINIKEILEGKKQKTLGEF